MAIKRDLWNEEFLLNDIPDWSCPTCGKGILQGDKATFTIKEDSYSNNQYGKEDWDSLWETGVFNGILECTNKKCKETVVLVGKMNYKQIEVFTREYGSEQIDVQCLMPKFFVPAPHIFPLNTNIPKDIKEVILEAFSLFWVDTSACANRIRVIVENIMNDHNIKKTTLKDGKRKKLPLNSRIIQFKVKYPEAGDFFMAIKWIGNHGSHSIEPMDKNNILNGFDILEHAVNKIYETDNKRIEKLSKGIIKKKGPIK